MKKLVLFFLIIANLYSCTNDGRNNELSNNKMNAITTKWNFEESNANICEDDKSNSPTSCVFIYNGKRYLRVESYILDKTGKIDSIYAYHNPLGVNIYSVNDYGRLMMNLDTAGFNEMKAIQIKWDHTKNVVVDNKESKSPTKIEKDRIIIEKGSDLIIYGFEN